MLEQAEQCRALNHYPLEVFQQSLFLPPLSRPNRHHDSHGYWLSRTVIWCNLHVSRLRDFCLQSTCFHVAALPPTWAMALCFRRFLTVISFFTLALGLRTALALRGVAGTELYNATLERLELLSVGQKKQSQQLWACTIFIYVKGQKRPLLGLARWPALDSTSVWVCPWPDLVGSVPIGMVYT